MITAVLKNNCAFTVFLAILGSASFAGAQIQISTHSVKGPKFVSYHAIKSNDLKLKGLSGDFVNGKWILKHNQSKDNASRINQGLRLKHVDKSLNIQRCTPLLGCQNENLSADKNRFRFEHEGHTFDLELFSGICQSQCEAYLPSWALKQMVHEKEAISGLPRQLVILDNNYETFIYDPLHKRTWLSFARGKHLQHFAELKETRFIEKDLALVLDYENGTVVLDFKHDRVVFLESSGIYVSHSGIGGEFEQAQRQSLYASSSFFRGISSNLQGIYDDALIEVNLAKMDVKEKAKLDSNTKVFSSYLQGSFFTPTNGQIAHLTGTGYKVTSNVAKTQTQLVFIEGDVMSHDPKRGLILSNGKGTSLSLNSKIQFGQSGYAVAEKGQGKSCRLFYFQKNPQVSGSFQELNTPLHCGGLYGVGSDGLVRVSGKHIVIWRK
jgi:hypothetical protein